MQRKVRVAILEDHQSIIDGYVYRLANNPRIEVVGSITYGEELEAFLARRLTPDVLILDVNVPTSPDNPSPYPILHVIPSLLQKHPDLNIIIISMFADHGLVRAAVDAGASGYIHKEDRGMLLDLGSVILSVADGGICFSQRAHRVLLSGDTIPIKQRLTARQMEALSLCAAYPNQTTAELAHKMEVSNSTAWGAEPRGGDRKGPRSGPHQPACPGVVGMRQGTAVAFATRQRVPSRQ